MTKKSPMTVYVSVDSGTIQVDTRHYGSGCVVHLDGDAENMRQTLTQALREMPQHLKRIWVFDSSCDTQVDRDWTHGVSPRDLVQHVRVQVQAEIAKGQTPMCQAKHTRYQPTEAEWRCPKCQKDVEFFYIDGPAEESEGDCIRLHEEDSLLCQNEDCRYETSGKSFAARIAKQKSLMTCPTCKGKGMVVGKKEVSA